MINMLAVINRISELLGAVDALHSQVERLPHGGYGASGLDYDEWDLVTEEQRKLASGLDYDEWDLVTEEQRKLVRRIEETYYSIAHQVYLNREWLMPALRRGIDPGAVRGEGR